nr:DUF2971 domain-containing protein [uncultured Peptoniphilus sp.]
MFNYLLQKDTKNKLREYALSFDISTKEIMKINQSIPTKLYKYCSLNKFSLRNLLKNELTASSPKVFNDLYDATIHKNSSQTVRRELDELSQLPVMSGSVPVKMNEEKIYCIERTLKRSDRLSMRSMTEPFKIVSLSEANNSILMWSHYADMNRGICIEYDFTKLQTATSGPQYQKLIFPVLYLDNPLDMSDLKEKELLNSMLLSAISKYKTWGYEKEWRILSYIETTQARIPLINIPTPTAIYLGKNFKSKWADEENKSLFDSFCNYIAAKNIELYIMSNEVLSYKLQSRKITLNELIYLDEFEIEDKFLD